MICFSFPCIPITPSNQLKENRIFRRMQHSNGLKIMAQEIRNKSFTYSRFGRRSIERTLIGCDRSLVEQGKYENRSDGHIKGPYLVKTTLFIPKKYENVKIVKLNSLELTNCHYFADYVCELKQSKSLISIYTTWLYLQYSAELIVACEEALNFQWQARRSTREYASGRASELQSSLTPRSRAYFRVPLAHDFHDIPLMESLLAGITYSLCHIPPSSCLVW